jgi:CRISPR/Cas system-associated endoribonuclease Cas2
MSEQKLASPPADEWRIMFRPLGSNTPVSWVQESFYMRELTAATARADALQAENERTIKELHKCDDECTRLTVALVAAENARAEARRQVDALVKRIGNSSCCGFTTEQELCNTRRCCDCWREWSANEARKGAKA